MNMVIGCHAGQVGMGIFSTAIQNRFRRVLTWLFFNYPVKTINIATSCIDVANAWKHLQRSLHLCQVLRLEEVVLMENGDKIPGCRSNRPVPGIDKAGRNGVEAVLHPFCKLVRACNGSGGILRCIVDEDDLVRLPML